MTLGDLAAWSTLAAIGALIVSAVALALFFGGAGSFWGPVNDVFVALFLFLLLPAVVAVWRLSPDDIGPWFGILSLAAMAGIAVAAVGQLLLVAGVIELRTSFVTGAIGVVPILLWMAGLAILVFTRQVTGVEVGWALVASLALAMLVALSVLLLPDAATAALSVLMTVALVAWLVALAAGVRLAA
jgi:hypothetical protein